MVCPNPHHAPERWRGNFLQASDLFFEAGILVLYFEESWTAEAAPHVEPAG